MSSMDVGSEHPAAQGAVEGPVLIHVWEVLEPGHEDLVVERLDTMLTASASEPGFVSARVLQSADGRSIAVVLEMRTVEDRQRLEQLPWVRETLGHLDETMNIIIRLYHQVHEYHA
jgi:Antibiotic biosynthesis monooxygenase